MIELRPYQRDVVAACAHLALGDKLIVVAPTGAGKTVIAAEIISKAVANGKRVLVMGHTREIIKQISTKLFAHDIAHGVIQAGFMTRPDASVQVASIQTLWARAMRANRMELPSADLLIIDEAHHCPANTYRRIIDAYPQAVLIGLTATPWPMASACLSWATPAKSSNKFPRSCSPTTSRTASSKPVS
jgi:DNA repair protein RadD